MIASLIALALALPVGDQSVGDATVGVTFDLGELAGWTPLDPPDVIPYHREGMRSELVFGARSEAGSYTFVTVIDNTLDRPALDASEVSAFFSEETYAHLEPRSFALRPWTVDSAGARLTAARLEFETMKLPYEVGTAGHPAVVSVALVPVVIRDERSGAHRNLILVADFRGDRADLAAFVEMSRRVVVEGEQFSIVGLAEFNANRDRLAAAAIAVPSRGVPPSVTAVGLGGGEEPDELARAVERLARGSATRDDRHRLASYALADGTTPLAESIRRLQRRERIRFEAAVWRALPRPGRDSRIELLAARLLSESIALDDPEAALDVTGGAGEAGLTVGDLECAGLEPLIAATLAWRGSSVLARDGVRGFFAVAEPFRCKRLHRLLAEQGVPLLTLGEVATPARDGRWLLRRGDPGQRFFWHDGRLVEAAVDRRFLTILPVANLLDAILLIENPR